MVAHGDRRASDGPVSRRELPSRVALLREGILKRSPDRGRADAVIDIGDNELDLKPWTAVTSGLPSTNRGVHQQMTEPCARGGKPQGSVRLLTPSD